MDVPDTQKISKSLRRRYILALSIIAVLVISGQGLIQYTLTNQEGDSRVINIAGRQRMLSQRIVKCALLLESLISETERRAYREELSQSLNLWVQSHAGLLFGDAELGLRGNNSPQVVAMFGRIEPHFQAMVQAVNVILAGEGPDYNRNDTLGSLLFNQAEFLRGMDDIVFQYDAEAKRKVTITKNMEVVILFVTFLTLLLEVVFIFRPGETQLQNIFEEYQRSETGLKRLFDMTPTPMVMVSLNELRLVRVNQAAANLLAISEKESTSKTLYNFRTTKLESDVAWNHVLTHESLVGIELPMYLRGHDAMVMAFTTRTNFEGKPHLILGLIDITEKHIQNVHLVRLAATDSMTGLMNRRAFLGNLEVALLKAREEKMVLSLAFLDLDGLKNVNDTYGHQEGDWFIRIIASFLRNSICEGSAAGRLGGDEFAVIFPGCPKQRAREIILDIRDQMKALELSFGKPYCLDFSFGAVSVDGGEDMDAEMLLQKADKAMYQQKHEHRLEQISEK